MHISDEILRTLLDHELDEELLLRVNEHLAACPQCETRKAEIARQASLVQGRLEILAPLQGDFPRPASSFISKIKAVDSQKPLKMPFFRIPRLAWALVAFAVILFTALSFQPVRALARNFLGLFRIQQIHVLPVDLSVMQDIRFEETAGEALTKMFTDHVVITRESGEATTAGSIEEAAALAGFTPRLPVNETVPGLMVKPGMAFEFTLNTAEAQSIMNDLGRNDLVIPAEFDQVKAAVDIPDSVSATYGDCAYEQGKEGSSGPSLGIGSDCQLFVQAPSPVVVVTPEVNLTELTKLGLQFLGKSPEEAETLSQQIDWATTLVIPVPTGSTRTETVSVDGVMGTLIQQAEDETDLVPSHTLIWVKDGQLYAVFASGDAQRSIDLANSFK